MDRGASSRAAAFRSKAGCSSKGETALDQVSSGREFSEAALATVPTHGTGQVLDDGSLMYSNELGVQSWGPPHSHFGHGAEQDCKSSCLRHFETIVVLREL